MIVLLFDVCCLLCVCRLTVIVCCVLFVTCHVLFVVCCM